MSIENSELKNLNSAWSISTKYFFASKNKCFFTQNHDFVLGSSVIDTTSCSAVDGSDDEVTCSTVAGAATDGTTATVTITMPSYAGFSLLNCFDSVTAQTTFCSTPGIQCKWDGFRHGVDTEITESDFFDRMCSTFPYDLPITSSSCDSAYVADTFRELTMTFSKSVKVSSVELYNNGDLSYSGDASGMWVIADCHDCYRTNTFAQQISKAETKMIVQFGHLGHECKDRTATTVSDADMYTYGSCTTCSTGYMTDGSTNHCRQCDRGYKVTAGTPGDTDDVGCSIFSNADADKCIAENGYVPGTGAACTLCSTSLSNCYTCSADSSTCTNCFYPYTLDADTGKCVCSAPHAEVMGVCEQCTLPNCGQCSDQQSSSATVSARYIKLYNFGDRSGGDFGHNIEEIIVRTALGEQNFLTKSDWSPGRICHGGFEWDLYPYDSSLCFPDTLADGSVSENQYELRKLCDGNGDTGQSFKPSVSAYISGGGSAQVPWIEIDLGSSVNIAEIAIKNTDDSETKSWIVDGTIEAHSGINSFWSATFDGENDWYVEEKFHKDNFRVLREMRILAKIRMGILDFVGDVVNFMAI